MHLASEEDRRMLFDFVSKHSTKPDLQYEYVPAGMNNAQTSSYLLFVASINQGVKAETIGKFVRWLWDQVGDEMLHLSELKIEDAKKLIDDGKHAVGLHRGERGNDIDDLKILQSVSSYLLSINANLPSLAISLATPQELVEQLCANIWRFGRDSQGARKKAWMYMRWMVRPHPDLGILVNFSPNNLEIPLDRNTCKAFRALRRRFPDDSSLGEMECDRDDLPVANANNRRRATQFAKTIFPDDPAMMDYPLFLYGSGRVKGLFE